MVSLDFVAVTISLPTIGSSLVVDARSLQWVLTAFALAFGGMLLLGGRAADRYGRRRMLILGLLLFGAATLTGGLASSLGVLVAARAAQGIGAAAVIPAALSIITTGFPEGTRRNRALGLYGALLSSGLLAGVLVGALVAAADTWRLALLVNAPLSLAAAGAVAIVVPRSDPPVESRRLDLPGATSVTLAVGLVIYTLASAEPEAAFSRRTLTLIGVAALMFVLFLAIEARTADPLVPLRLPGGGPLLCAAGVGAVVAGAATGAMYVLTLNMQTVLNYTAAQTAIAFGVISGAAVIAGPVCARFAERVGATLALALAVLVEAVGIAFLLALSVGRGLVLMVLLSSAALIGFGRIAATVAFTIVGTSRISNAQHGLATGALFSAQQLGEALFVTLMAGVIAIAAPAAAASSAPPTAPQIGELVGAFQVGAAIATGLTALVAAAVAAVWIRNRRLPHAAVSATKPRR